MLCSLLTHAPVVLLRAEEAVHEHDRWAIVGAGVGRLVELVCKWKGESWSCCGEDSLCEHLKSRVIARSSAHWQALFAGFQEAY